MREEDTPKERGGEDAVIRYSQGCREGESDREGEDYAEDGCFAGRYCENAAAVWQILPFGDDRKLQEGSVFLTGGASETAVGRGAEAKASLAAVWESGGEAKIACCCTCETGLTETIQLI